MMSDIAVRYYIRRSDGQLEDLSHEHDLSDFGGVCPSVGDRIVDQGAEINMNRNDPKNRQIHTVAARYFLAKGHRKYVALVIESRAATMDEIDLL